MQSIPAPVAAPLPADEAARLADLYEYEILGTDPEAGFDDLALLASRIVGTPIALVNLLDAEQQFTKASVGLDLVWMPRDESFCTHTIVEENGVLVVPNALEDARFSHNPHVLGGPKIRFYAGSTIRSAEGRAIGVLCAIDNEPRTLGTEQLAALEALSRNVTTQLELRRLLAGERRTVAGLQELDRQKAEFTAVVAHDLRSPLTSIRGYAELLRESDDERETALSAIDRGAEHLLQLVDDLTGSAAELSLEAVDLEPLVRAAVDCATPAAGAAGVTLIIETVPVLVLADRHRIAQALDNLVGNAIKYAPGGIVEVCLSLEREHGVVTVRDDGIGIPAAELDSLFDRFFRASTARSGGFPGSGIGLSIVQRIVETHGGTLDVESDVGNGTTFRLTLPGRS